MRKILIVEDELLIRRGIKSMIERSGVTFEEIMEAKNGIEALALLQAQPFDVMLTDIKMPKMDGITLVKEATNLGVLPLTIVISGFDDFNFAVEMLRNGVREYILKPIERETLFKVLQNLEMELQSSVKEEQKEELKLTQGIKMMLFDHYLSVEDQKILIDLYQEQFFEHDYFMMLLNHKIDLSIGYEFEVNEKGYLYIFDCEEEALVHRYTKEYCFGQSAKHQGFHTLKKAYLEALSAREYAFVCGKATLFQQHIQEKYHVFEKEREQIIQLIGIHRKEDINKIFHQIAMMMKKDPDLISSFQIFCNLFIEQLQQAYQNVIEIDEQLVLYKKSLLFDDVDHYLQSLQTWIYVFIQKLANEYQDYENKQKIQQALHFIKTNYMYPINMAEVSNDVNMNYSLFSQLFKLYTGTNFVKYLHQLRIEESKVLLKETDLKIYEISEKVGYVDDKHFMKLFKNLTGVSPSDYRKTLQYQQSSED